MGKRKPLSMAEKQVKMLELFHETASFFTYKEIERLADKQKGITPQSAKDVLDELVSQQKVSCEKLASQTLYFSLPSQAITRRKRTRAQLDNDTARCAAAVAQLKDRLQKRQAVCHIRPQNLAYKTWKAAFLTEMRAPLLEQNSCRQMGRGRRECKRRCTSCGSAGHG